MNRIKGELNLPGDKSISHRSALFAALYQGRSDFKNFNYNADCTATLHCLRRLGIRWKAEKETLIVWGKHPKSWSGNTGALDARNSGTTARLLSGLLAGIPRKNILSGDESLSKRPMKRIIDPLRQMGAHIESTSNHLPLHFFPVPALKGIRYELPVASAQVKSAVLLAGLLAEGKTMVIENSETRDHTERLLRLPVTVERETKFHRVIESSMDIPIPNLSMAIPGDISSAAFFIAAAVALPGSELLIQNVSLNPTRMGFVSQLQKMGASIGTKLTAETPEPAGQMIIRHSDLRNISIDPSVIPNIIDEIPILTIVALQAEGRFEISGAEELRYKESDRIRVMADNLRRLGIALEEKPDGLLMDCPQKMKGGRIKTYGDHRIAMAFAIANLLTEEDITMDDPGCVAVSFPDFWKHLTRLVRHG